MPTYIITVLDQHGDREFQLVFDAFSDPEALERARAIAEGKDVKVEQAGRPVATVHPKA